MKKINQSIFYVIFLLGFIALSVPALAQETYQVGEMMLDVEDAEKLFKKPGYSPYAGRNFPTRVYWGDSHLHTNLSLDARAFGNTLGTEDAYRFARGEEITATHGERIKLSRPLDWLVIADHSDGMGAMNEIIKGWLDKKGKTHEKVYDVVWSGDRKPGKNGKLPAVGNTVNIAKATWTNTIGAPELITAWTDPDFDPKQRAVYYARVIEIPTPRWPAYDAKRFGVNMSDEVPMTTQERAYTSPIWYTPAP